jgi:hypothetical protein
MGKKIRDIKIVVESTGKVIPIVEMNEDIEVRDLLVFLAFRELGHFGFGIEKFLYSLGNLCEKDRSLTALISERLGLNLTANLADSVLSIEIEEEITPYTFIKLLATDKEILEYLACERRLRIPTLPGAVLIRKLTHKQLSSRQTFDEVGIENGETLILDYARVAGGCIRFYSNGNLREIIFTPEETADILKVLGELYHLRERLASNLPPISHNDGRRAAWREQLAIHHKNLRHLETQLAKYGSLNAPLHLPNQIEDEKAEIERLETLLGSG